MSTILGFDIPTHVLVTTPDSPNENRALVFSIDQRHTYGLCANEYMRRQSITVFESIKLVNDLIAHLLSGGEFRGEPPPYANLMREQFADAASSLAPATPPQVDAWDMKKCMEDNKPIGVDLSIAMVPFVIKVQMPLATTEDQPMALVYDETRKRIDEQIPTGHFEERMNGRPKAFFNAVFILNRLDIQEEVEDPGW